ncbi:MAG: adenylyltransferase/cytidyltransferase family protein [Bacteroidaceae bacterium]|nr:adenylyltransferase/cytidyltransferase family protein [Bacteroidaceae bacterium]
MRKKVFVSGCYDMLHSGHVAFFKEASTYGDLYVGIGSDATIRELKDRKTINTERERLYMVKAIRYVTDAFVNSGSGIMDFAEDVKRLKPDIFFVNSDGYTPGKKRFCEENGIELVVSTRIPEAGLPKRSTTALRQECNIPYRIDLAGGWLDQPYVSKHHGGPVLTISIEPDYDFNNRGGMSTSSRKAAIEMWHVDIPEGDRETLAKMVFRYENPPGSPYISGSQDAIGIVMPGLNRLNYTGDYWPESIESNKDADVLDFIEKYLWLVPLAPRDGKYDVLANTNIDAEGAKRLAQAADDCWNAIINKDIDAWGKACTASFEAQVAMFPNMISDHVAKAINEYKDRVKGYKITGAGGGGYLVLINDTPIEEAIQIRIRRN